MRLLLVGDYHADVSDLDDCKKLSDYIIRISEEYKVPVVFMGDQYHHHGVINAEIQLFWIEFFNRFKHRPVALVGNHDRPGSSHSRATAMLAHVHNVTVIRQPTVIDSILYVPYYDDPEVFVSLCNQFPNIHTVFCHQTFNGSQYDNGIYAKEGIDPNLIPQKLIISGHIHAPQEFGKVWYIGSPRWRTLSDANTERAIWLVDFNTDGLIANKVSFDTGDVCRKIYKLEEREDGTELLPMYLDPKHEWRIDLYGSSKYLEERSRTLKAMGVKVRTFRTELEQPKVKESEGIKVAFDKWVESYQGQFGTDKAVLRDMINKRIQNG